MANLVSSAMLVVPSFRMIWTRWVSTVLVLTFREKATSLVFFPSAMSWSTSRSRGVRRPSDGASVRPRFPRKSLTTTPAMRGLR